MSAPDPHRPDHPTPEYQDGDPPAAAGPHPERPAAEASGAGLRPRRVRPLPGRRLASPDAAPAPLTAEQRLLIVDSWRRSGPPAGDFAPLVGVSKHTLYAWEQRFEAQGPAGLADRPRGGPEGSRLPEVTRRAILMLKEDNPDWGCERISAMLQRGPDLPTLSVRRPACPRKAVGMVPDPSLCVKWTLVH